MAGYIGTKAVSLSTTAADVSGDATIDGTLTVGTGVDVTGTVTADGLTVDGAGKVKTGTSGGSANVVADDFIVEASGSGGITISTPSTGVGTIAFGDESVSIQGRIAFSHISNSMQFYTNNSTERMRIDSSGNVGIGTSSPECALHVNGTNTTLLITEDSEGSATLQFGDTQSSTSQSFAISYDTGGTNEALFKRNNSKVGMWMNEGFIVGTATNATSPYAIFTANNDATKAGVGLRDVGYLAVGRYNEQCAYFNRMTSDGTIVDFRKDGTVVGSIGSLSGQLVIGSTHISGSYLTFASNQVRPATNTGANRDNIMDLGNASARFDDVYATNGTIQTSDANEKQQIAELTTAEMQAAKAISKLFKTFKWNDSVAEKGDDARIHSGVIAQEVEAAMTDAGLDAGRYAFFISNTWWESTEVIPAVEEVLDEEGNVVTEAQAERTVTHTHETAEEAPIGAVERNRKGIRYPQLLSFIGAATEQRLASIEARLDTLEGN